MFLESLSHTIREFESIPSSNNSSKPAKIANSAQDSLQTPTLRTFPSKASSPLSSPRRSIIMHFLANLLPLVLLSITSNHAHASEPAAIGEFQPTDNHCKESNSRAGADKWVERACMGFGVMNAAANVGMYIYSLTLFVAQAQRCLKHFCFSWR